MEIPAAVVNDLSDKEVRYLLSRYDFQIRNALRIIKRNERFSVEARVALNAANAARKKKQWLIEKYGVVA